MADQILPTWGQSLGQGISGGFENFMNARASARKQRIEDAALAIQYAQLDQQRGEAGRKDMEFAQETGVPITPKDFTLGREMSQAAGMAPDPQGFRERLPTDQANALSMFDQFMAKAGPEVKAKKDQGLKLSEKASIEGVIMDDWLKSQTYQTLSTAKSALRDLASIQKNSSGAADIAAIYSFVKTMDPNAVKEGEIALAQSAIPGMDKLKLIYDSLKAGNKITPKMKKELLTVAHGMYKSKQKTAKEFRDPFVKRAQQYDINPDIAAPSLDIGDEELAAMLAEPVQPGGKYSGLSDEEILKRLGE